MVGRTTASALAKQLPGLRETDQNIRNIIVRATGCDEAWLAEEESHENELDVVAALTHGFIHKIRGPNQ
jgi:hypothetical protein